MNKCINYKEGCDNANTCPCLLYQEQEYQKVEEYIMCSENSLCPCATGWCNNKQPNTDCIEFLATAISTRAAEIRNASGIIEYIKNNETEDNKVIEYPPCSKVDGDSIPRCLNLIERQYCGGTVCK